MILFLNRLNGLIERKTRKSIYENLDDVTIMGFEILSGGWITDGFFGRLGYTYLSAQEESPYNDAQQLRRIPEHTLGVELRYKFPFNLLFAINTMYVAELFDLDADEIYTRMPNYLLLDAKVSLNVRRGVEAYLAASNLLDENYMTRMGFPMEGRAVRLGLTLKL